MTRVARAPRRVFAQVADAAPLLPPAGLRAAEPPPPLLHPAPAAPLAPAALPAAGPRPPAAAAGGALPLASLDAGHQLLLASMAEQHRALPDTQPQQPWPPLAGLEAHLRGGAAGLGGLFGGALQPPQQQHQQHLPGPSAAQLASLLGAEWALPPPAGALQPPAFLAGPLASQRDMADALVAALRGSAPPPSGATASAPPNASPLLQGLPGLPPLGGGAA